MDRDHSERVPPNATASAMQIPLSFLMNRSFHRRYVGVVPHTLDVRLVRV
jgi:hypothetical protein